MTVFDKSKEELFKMMDKDKDGKVDMNDIIATYSEFNFPSQASKLMMRCVSKNVYMNSDEFQLFYDYVTSWHKTFEQVSQKS